jgi:hypothetical protein
MLIITSHAPLLHYFPSVSSHFTLPFSISLFLRFIFLPLSVSFISFHSFPFHIFPKTTSVNIEFTKEGEGGVPTWLYETTGKVLSQEGSNRNPQPVPAFTVCIRKTAVKSGRLVKTSVLHQPSDSSPGWQSSSYIFPIFFHC